MGVMCAANGSEGAGGEEGRIEGDRVVRLHDD